LLVSEENTRGNHRGFFYPRNVVFTFNEDLFTLRLNSVMKFEGMRDYFLFTKKERMGIFALLVLIFAVAVVPHFFEPELREEDKIEFNTLENEIARLNAGIQADTVSEVASNHSPPIAERANYQPGTYEKSGDKQATLFYFDPNLLPDSGWRALGLRSGTIHTIRSYLSKGGRFRSPDDLGKIYGLHHDEYERLLPFVRMGGTQAITHNTENQNPYNTRREVLKQIEINSADSLDWLAMPGIGAKLTSRILRFRERLGGFYSVDQVAETYGLPDSSFQKIRPWLKIEQATIRKIDINTASVEELKQHPYIRGKLAYAIVRYREQHGQFKNAEDLKQLMIADSLVVRKLENYLIIK